MVTKNPRSQGLRKIVFIWLAPPQLDRSRVTANTDPAVIFENPLLVILEVGRVEKDGAVQYSCYPQQPKGGCSSHGPWIPPEPVSCAC
jgi:hypothetical protein